MYDLTGKVALVTGSERGLGKTTAIMLAQQGADIVMAYFQEEMHAMENKAEIEKMGRRVIAVQADLTREEEARRVADEALKMFGHVDIIVNVVGGVIKRIPFVESTDAVWDAAFKLNVMSMVHINRMLLPQMITQKYGRIINISSLGSKTGGAPNSAHYSAMKGAINSYTHSLSNEVAKDGVTVNAVLPGTMISPLLLETPSWSEDEVRRKYPIGRMSVTEDVVPMIAFLASEEARYVTGEIYAVSGGR